MFGITKFHRSCGRSLASLGRTRLIGASSLLDVDGTTLIDFQGGIDGQFIKDLTVDTHQDQEWRDLECVGCDAIQYFRHFR